MEVQDFHLRPRACLIAISGLTPLSHIGKRCAPLMVYKPLDLWPLSHTWGAWNAQKIGVYPRIRCAALSWPSASFTYTSDCRILSMLTLLTKLNKGLVEQLSAKSLKQRKMNFDKNRDREKRKKNTNEGV